MGWFDERFEPLHDRLRFDCLACGRPMWFPQSKHGKYKTCGGECASERRAGATESRARPCATCGSEFSPRPGQLRIGHGRYCSQKCNVAGIAAANSKEARDKARAAWKAKNAAEPFIKSGPDNPKWKGGRKAAVQRRIASGAMRIAYHTRRARGAKPVSPKAAQALGALQRWKCAICVRGIKTSYHVDHIVPVSRGGKTEVWNLQLLCPPCNLKKHAKDPIEYMQSLGRLL